MQYILCLFEGIYIYLYIDNDICNVIYIIYYTPYFTLAIHLDNA